MLEQKFPRAALSFFATKYFTHYSKNIILAVSNEDEAIKLYKQALFFSSHNNILYFPSYDITAYDHISPNVNILSTRASVLTRLLTNENPKLLITYAANLLAKLPPKDFFIKLSLKLYPKMKFTSEKFANFLVANSFNRNATAIDIGDFAMRGEIIDVILPGPCAYRINFSWDYIESIKEFDINTQISTSQCQEIIISPASEVILNNDTINNFKDNYLRNFGVNHTNTALYEAITSKRKFPGYEQLLPLFYNSYNSLVDYMTNSVILTNNLSMQAILEFEHSCNDFYRAKLEYNKIKLDSFYPALTPLQLYFPALEITSLIKQKHNILAIPENSSQASVIENIGSSSFLEKKTVFDKLFEVIKIYVSKTIIICCSSLSLVTRLKSIITNYEQQYKEINKLSDAVLGMINLTIMPLDHNFYTQQYLFITANELLREKLTNNSTVKANNKLKNILLELNNLQEEEFIVHKDHGVGKFLKVETLEVKGKTHDFLKILYANNDKLYIPVENIEVIKKYGSNHAELDRLGSVSWQKNKSKLKNRIKEIAIILLQNAAKRKINIATATEFNIDEYNRFCNKFPFVETPDQINAINDIQQDFTSGALMDRLICGDVGFGKTEVAMRAAFMIAKSSSEHLPQIAVIVPTTILCSQHFARFSERFQGFGLNIKQLSSVVNPKEAKIIKQQLENGKVNIIIGTHALLNKHIKFLNLKLLIIDEEQHFGVSQKEFLKDLKSSVHVLTMSATPIPRTLQMSMNGLKELSIIATPPMNRLEVRTSITPYDRVIIRDALLREHFRGGRSFYVVPRINDIASVEKELLQIVPELKYKVAHGKMSPGKIDEIMSEFYAGKFDILVSTTIIESGIDIADANTMVIHNADILGLSQLYQLRGRIGRSKVRGYAYLTLTNYKKTTKHSLRHLDIIQNSCALGSGFTIANHDMDLRGFGNLVGEEQSGQIKEVGFELYQEMLEEQIAILKNEPITQDQPFTPMINLGIPVFIPDNYVSDSVLKLGLYRRIGALQDNIEVEKFKDEMMDRFGSIPQEFNNLLDIVKIKLLCLKLNIENLDSGTQGFVIKFYKNADISDKIFKFINNYPEQTKIKPNNKLIFIQKLTEQNVIFETNQLLEKVDY